MRHPMVLEVAHPFMILTTNQAMLRHVTVSSLRNDELPTG